MGVGDETGVEAQFGEEIVCCGEGGVCHVVGAGNGTGAGSKVGEGVGCYVGGVEENETVRCRLNDGEGHGDGWRDGQGVETQVGEVVCCRVRDGEGPGEGGRDGPEVRGPSRR